MTNWLTSLPGRIVEALLAAGVLAVILVWWKHLDDNYGWPIWTVVAGGVAVACLAGALGYGLAKALRKRPEIGHEQLYAELRAVNHQHERELRAYREIEGRKVK